MGVRAEKAKESSGERDRKREGVEAFFRVTLPLGGIQEEGTGVCVCE